MTGIIYKATNLYNGLIYIGQTRVSLASRMKRHYQDALSDSSNHFHHALLQYGKEGFEWEVVDTFSGSKEEVIHALNVAEEYHILKYKSRISEYGYNATKGGYSSDKFDEAIRRRALASYGSKAVLQYDLDGNFIKEFESLIDVARYFNKGKLKARNIIGTTYKGYQWREKTNERFPRKIASNRDRRSEAQSVIVYDKSGKFYKEYKSIATCYSDLGVHYKPREFSRNISFYESRTPEFLVFRKPIGDYPERIRISLITKKDAISSRKGAAKERGCRVLQYSADGRLIKEHNSIEKAHREVGVSCSVIRKSLKKPIPYKVDWQTKFIWRKATEKTMPTIEVEISRTKKSEPKKETKEHRVIQYNNKGEVVKVWKNMLQASIQTGESHNLIRKQCLGIPIKKNTPSIWRYYCSPR